jgi:hypothetical protein
MRTVLTVVIASLLSFAATAKAENVDWSQYIESPSERAAHKYAAPKATQDAPRAKASTRGVTKVASKPKAKAKSSARAKRGRR